MSSEPHEITFQTVVGGVKTKADPNQLEYDKNSTFGAFAFQHTGSFADVSDESGFTKYIENAEIKYDATAKSWHAENMYYWPKNGSYLTFYAYSPFSISISKVSEGQTSPVSCTGKDGIKITDWDVEKNQTVDIMVADAEKDKTENGANGGFTGVPTVFRHKLTQIAGFTVKTQKAYSGITITVKKIEITGVKHKGTYVQGTEVWTADDAIATYTWYDSSKEGSSNYSIQNNTNSLSVVPNALSEDANSKECLYVLPQEFTEDAKLKITYSRNYPIGDQTAEIKLSDLKDKKDDVVKWDMNKKITYTIIFTLDEILWAPSVVDWSEDGGSANINI